MATRIEAERRAEHEVEIAREVQRQLLPAPCSGPGGVRVCRGVHTGEVRRRRLLRFRRAGSRPRRFRPGRRLRQGHRGRAAHGQSAGDAEKPICGAAGGSGPPSGGRKPSFLASTPGNRYATLFLADFDAATRELRYVNCGHVPPVLARSSGAIETLAPTATVIGSLRRVDRHVRHGAPRTRRYAGRLQRRSDRGVERRRGGVRARIGCGQAVAAQRGLPVPELLTRLQASVQQFAGVVQSDDLTLLVARAMPSTVTAVDTG